VTDFAFEDRYAGIVAGVDEAGRGPWAGPVVAAAVVLDRGAVPDGLNDSKQLSAVARERLFGAITLGAHYGIGQASVAEIDSLNIHWATMLAMERAVAALGVAPDHVLVDGNRLPKWRHAATAIVKGDALSCSIAAASILAKVSRDRMMRAEAENFPGFHFHANKGYPCPKHKVALAGMGPTTIHRRTWAFMDSLPWTGIRRTPPVGTQASLF
jgi:ribonuclease HII